MIRYRAGSPSQTSPAPPAPAARVASHLEFFTGALAELHGAGFPENTPLLLLTGAADWRGLALRAAQAVVRLDRQPSFWSHAALLLRWNRAAPAAATGVEVSFTPHEPQRQVPERNGATLFALEQYCDGARYPHVALIAFRQRPRSPRGANASRPALDLQPASVRAAALSPSAERIRYPCWDQLAAWSRYLYEPYSAPNPLTAGVPLPCASFCEYAFEAGGLDLSPGSTGPQVCPEMFWATALVWRESLAAAGVEVRVLQQLGERYAFTREALSTTLEDDFGA